MYCVLGWWCIWRSWRSSLINDRTGLPAPIGQPKQALCSHSRRTLSEPSRAPQSHRVVQCTYIQYFVRTEQNPVPNTRTHMSQQCGREDRPWRWKITAQGETKFASQSSARLSVRFEFSRLHLPGFHGHIPVADAAPFRSHPHGSVRASAIQSGACSWRLTILGLGPMPVSSALPPSPLKNEKKKSFLEFPRPPSHKVQVVVAKLQARGRSAKRAERPQSAALRFRSKPIIGLFRKQPRT